MCIYVYNPSLFQISHVWLQSVATTSEVCISALLLVLAIGSEEVLHYVHTIFIENWSTLANVKMDGPTNSKVI